MLRIPNPNYLGSPTPEVVTAVQLQRIDTFFLLPFIYNLIADFLALNITRLTLSRLSQLDTATVERVVTSISISIIAILVVSLGVLYVDFKIMDYILRLLYHATATAPPDRLVLSFRDALLFPFYKRYPLVLGNCSESTLYGVFVWSTLMGIFWIGAFGLSLLVASISVRLGSVGSWLEKRFKVRSQPFGILKVFALIPAVAIHYIVRG